MPTNTRNHNTKVKKLELCLPTAFHNLQCNVNNWTIVEIMPQSLSRFGRPLAVIVLILTLSGFVALESMFAPKAELWDRWTAHDVNSATSVDHAPWDLFLKNYVTTDPEGLNRVAYGRVSEADKKALHGYLSALRAVRVSALNRAEQQAYWINMYNALTVRLILDFYPVATIQDIDIGSGLFSSGPWSKELIKIEGELVSLNDIEHRILRPIWNDPRIHYAVNCAAVGCPNLQRDAFTVSNMSAQLDRAAIDYINSPRGVRLVDGEIVASKIYTWFQEDFGNSEDGVLAHLKPFASAELAREISRINSISDYEYDWTLNGTAR